MKKKILSGYAFVVVMTVLALAAALTAWPYRTGAAASSGGDVFVPGRSYSMHLAGFADRSVRVLAVSGRWLRVKDKTGEYWLNSDWVLEHSESR